MANVAKPWILIRIDPAKKKFKITSFSSLSQWVSCSMIIKASMLLSKSYNAVLAGHEVFNIQLQYVGLGIFSSRLAPIGYSLISVCYSLKPRFFPFTAPELFAVTLYSHHLGQYQFSGPTQ